MNNSKKLMGDLITWRILFWSGVGIMTIVPFCLYYFDEKIGNLKTQIAIEKQKEEKIISLIDDLKKYPTNYDEIFRQFEIMEISTDLYPKFREIIPFINKFCAENNQIHKNFEDLHNRTIPLLLEKFPYQVYADETLDYEFNNRSQLYYIKEHRRLQMIKYLHEVILNSSIEKHRYAVRGLIYDLFWYNPTFLKEFKNTFGQEKINEIKKANLWTGQDLKDLAEECRSGLIKFGVIDSTLIK